MALVKLNTASNAKALPDPARGEVALWVSPITIVMPWNEAMDLAYAILTAVDKCRVSQSPIPDTSEISPALLDGLKQLGNQYGPLGVAIAATELTDSVALMAHIHAERHKIDVVRDPIDGPIDMRTASD